MSSDGSIQVKNIYNTPATPEASATTQDGDLLAKLGYFFAIYFLLYYAFSFFVSLETLTNIFRIFDFVILGGIIFMLVFSVLPKTKSAKSTFKTIWKGLKQILESSSSIFYLLAYIFAYWIISFLCRNSFAYSTPTVVSLLEGTIYVLFFIVLIIDVFQFAFSVSITQIMEKDFDRQYDSATGTTSTPPPPPPPPPKKKKKNVPLGGPI